MNDGTRYLGDIGEAAQEPDGPKLHGVTQPICVASLTSDVDQLGVTECEEPFELVRVGIALEATIPAGLLIGGNPTGIRRL